jgi:hypothetical protein
VKDRAKLSSSSWCQSNNSLLADSSDPQRTLSFVSIARVTESGPSNSSWPDRSKLQKKQLEANATYQTSRSIVSALGRFQRSLFPAESTNHTFQFLDPIGTRKTTKVPWHRLLQVSRADLLDHG